MHVSGIVIANRTVIPIHRLNFLNWIVSRILLVIPTGIVIAVTGVYLHLIQSLFSRIIFWGGSKDRDSDSINKYPYPEYLERGYDNDLSTRVENFYDTHTASLSIRGVHAKMFYDVGVGLTPQSSLSKTTIGPNYKKNLPEQNVLNWSPSMMFRYMFTKQHVLMFRYNGRSSTPNIEDLQDVIDITDPMNLRYGNPNLKPSFNSNFNLNYRRFIPESMRSYTMDVSYSNTLNSVANKMTYDPQTGARIYKKENVNGNWRTQGFFNFNTPLKNQKFTLATSVLLLV